MSNIIDVNSLIGSGTRKAYAKETVSIDKIDNLEWDITKYIVQGIQNYFQIHISSEDENYVYITWLW